MNRRQFLSASLGAALAPRIRAQARRPPNVVLILSDDLGWADLSCYGSSFYETPNLDRLASQGIRFTNGYSSCPVCSPARAGLLTGKYPARLHLTDWIPGRRQWPHSKLLRLEFKQQLPLEEITLAEALKPLGYASASIGKWHLGREDFYPDKQGFDLNYGGTERGSPPSFYAPFQIPGIQERGPDDYLDDNLTARAEEFIEENRDRPFFLYLPHFAVHLPYGGRKDLIAKYKSRPIPEKGQNNPVYAAMVESMDHAIGRLMQKLDETGLAENTLVIFTSDNGGLRYEGTRKELVTSNEPLRAGKGHCYEGGIRVPFILRWPGRIPAGVTNDTPVITMDCYPTILEACGATRHGGKHDAEPLQPLFHGGRLRRDALYWHYPHYSNQGGVPCGGIREGDWKLIEFYEDSRVELFNLRDDIGERRNLVRREAKTAQRLRAKLEKWRRSVNAHMPQPNPNYDPGKADQGLTGSEPPTEPV
jgi:arylsulfatase A-like enzyme